MHLSRIDLNLLVVFDAVFTAGSITAASRKLNLSQPAVSHALARLRDVFGEPLFERQGRGIAPTPFARSIAGPVREALGAMERTFGQAVADRVPHERVLTDRLVVIARKDHPRLRRMKRSGWSLDAYLELEHVQVSSRRRGPSLEDVALQALGRTRRIRLRCQSHAAACRATAGTDLVATLPETYVRHVLERDANQVVALPLDGINLETYMYWPANAERDAANRWLRDQVRTALRSRR